MGRILKEAHFRSYSLKIYTKTGDEGKTDLFFGGRVSKNNIRCEAYGETDSVVSALGLARSLCKDEKVRANILNIQNHLFTVGAELATLPENYLKMKDYYKTISEPMIIEMESLIDELSEEVDLPPNFVISGASTGSAALDIARSTLRSAERRIVDLNDMRSLVNPHILTFVNRLSDLLFMLSRYEDRYLPTEIISGQKLDDLDE